MRRPDPDPTCPTRLFALLRPCLRDALFLLLAPGESPHFTLLARPALFKLLLISRLVVLALRLLVSSRLVSSLLSSPHRDDPFPYRLQWNRELAWLLSEERLVSLAKLRRDDVAPVGATKTTKPDIALPLPEPSSSSPINKLNWPKSLPNSRTASPIVVMRKQSREHSSSPRSSTPGPRKERSADKRQTSPRCQTPPLTAGPHGRLNAGGARGAPIHLMRPPLVAASPEQNQEGQDGVGVTQRNDQLRMLDWETAPPSAELNVKEQKITQVLAAAQERANEAAQLLAKVSTLPLLWGGRPVFVNA